MNHLMIDLETLGTTADSVIMSIGAVKFDLEGDTVEDEGFYSSISIDSNLKAKRRVNESTMIWWLQQSAEAQKIFHEPKVHLPAALTELSGWLKSNDWIVWSKGANFDIPILEHAYKSIGMEPPWKFWNTRCVRTYMALPGAKGLQANTEGVKHNALSDAYEQAKTIQMIHQKLFK